MSALLLCIPQAGAGAEAFRAWEALRLPGIRVRPLPGPGPDLGSEGKSAAALMSRAEELAAKASPLLSADCPNVLFGHGLGALLSFELATRLLPYGAPLRLIASGSPDPWHHFGQDTAYCPAPIDVPVTAVRGSRDELVSHEAVAGWERATTGIFGQRELPGGHVYYPEQGRAVAELAGLTGQAEHTALAGEIAELWQQLLGVGKVDVHDDFFDLGGNSNSGLLMISHARRQGITITLRDLFRLRTPDAIARQCAPPNVP